MGSRLPQHVAVFGDEIFWTLPSGLKAAPIASGQERLLTSDAGSGDLAITGGNVYFRTFTPTGFAISRIPVGGGTSTTVVPDAGPVWRMLADANDVYWLCDSESIRRLSLATGEVSILRESPRLTGIALREGRLYYSDYDSIAWLDAGAATGATIVNDADAELLAVDETHVYWSAYPTGAIAPSMRIMRAPLEGGTPELFAVSPAIWDLAIDDEAVYWVDEQLAQIWRRRKH